MKYLNMFRYLDILDSFGGPKLEVGYINDQLIDQVLGSRFDIDGPHLEYKVPPGFGAWCITYTLQRNFGFNFYSFSKFQKVHMFDLVRDRMKLHIFYDAAIRIPINRQGC